MHDCQQHSTASTATWKHRFNEPVRFSSTRERKRAEEHQHDAGERSRHTVGASECTVHDAHAAPIAATSTPILASKRSTLSTGNRAREHVNGSISCDSAPQNAIATPGATDALSARRLLHDAWSRAPRMQTRRAPRYVSSVLVGVRQQRQKTRALDGDGELTLIVRLGSR